MASGSRDGTIHCLRVDGVAALSALQYQFTMEPEKGGVVSLEKGGVITHVCVGPSVHSVEVGTVRSFIAVFDLRFEFPVHFDASLIVSLYVAECRALLDKVALPELAHPDKGPLLVSTQRSSEICAFDLSTGKC